MSGAAHTLYVSNGRGDTVTPIATATNTAGPPIPVGRAPGWIAVTADGKIAYVTTDDPVVVPIATATGRAGSPIRVGVNRSGLIDHQLVAIAITPDGKTVYVAKTDHANGDRGTVTPIDTATNTPGEPIDVGVRPCAIVITPDGKTAYVVNQSRPQPPPWHSYEAEKRGLPQPQRDPRGTVTPIDTATNAPGEPIDVGNRPHAIAITPDGTTAYVTSWQDGTVTPIATATNTAGQRIPVGEGASAIAVTPDGETAYVVICGEPGAVVPIATATNAAGPPIPAGQGPYAIAMTP